MKQQSFIFIGRSGSGKGTQAKLLSDYLKEKDSTKEVLYVYTGEEFRKFINGNSDTQKLSHEINEKGKLQPEFLAVYMWIKVLVEKYTNKEHLIFDGTPRKYHEAGVLNSIFDFYGLEKPYVIHLDLDKDESVKRLKARGRSDDNAEDIAERLTWYETEVEPAIGYYRNNPNYVFLTIPALGSIEDIHRDIIGKMSL